MGNDCIEWVPVVMVLDLRIIYPNLSAQCCCAAIALASFSIPFIFIVLLNCITGQTRRCIFQLRQYPPLAVIVIDETA